MAEYSLDEIGIDTIYPFCFDVTQTFLEAMDAPLYVHDNFDVITSLVSRYTSEYFYSVAEGRAFDQMAGFDEALGDALGCNAIRFFEWISAVFVEIGSAAEARNRDWAHAFSLLFDACNNKNKSINEILALKGHRCDEIERYVLETSNLPMLIDQMIADDHSLTLHDKQMFRIGDELMSLIAPGTVHRSSKETYADQIQYSVRYVATERLRKSFLGGMSDSTKAYLFAWLIGEKALDNLNELYSSEDFLKV